VDYFSTIKSDYIIGLPVPAPAGGILFLFEKEEQLFSKLKSKANQGASPLNPRAGKQAAEHCASL
jgi:hypothetical protein